MAEEAGFEYAWKSVAAQVSARCNQLSRDPHEAQELCQLVAIRAWRGHATFRGDSAYLTWVMRILDRETIRLANQRNRTASREISLDPLDANDQFSTDSRGTESGTENSGGPEPGWLAALLADAAAGAAISDTELRVVSARLAHPDESWQRIAERLGMTATACAVTHSRAVPKLRVFLFTSRRPVIGGDQAVAGAFDQARRSGALTALEAEAFAQVVIRGSVTYRRRGSQAALRGACAKVAQRMGLA